METENKQMTTTNGTELAATASAAMAKAEIESAYVNGNETTAQLDERSRSDSCSV